MKPTILVKTHDEVHNKLITEKSIAQDLSDYFCFKVPGYEYIIAQMRRKNPGGKIRWNGDIRLFNRLTGKMYVGLMPRLESYAQERDIRIIYEHEPLDTEYSVVEAIADIESYGLTKMPREYQSKTFMKCVRKNRALVLSPTASGKSLMMYLLTRKYDTKSLIIVPTIGLITQLYNNFIEYGFDAESNVHMVYEGQAKDTPKPIVISTWQSIYDLPKDFFVPFQVAICDEVHHAQAKSLKHIMEMLVNAEHRFGFTGTLDDSLTHRLVLEGLFGPVITTATSAQLMKQEFLAQLFIKALVLRYPEEVCKRLRNASYQDEIDFLVDYEPRNRYIQNLTLSLDGNTLLLFRLVDRHGQILYDKIRAATNRPVYYIHGGTEKDDREAIRQIVQTQSNAIIVGSYGTMSTGIDIPNLDNIIFASPYKSKIKVLQSIGRGLRTAHGKTHCMLFDIADDLTYKTHRNHTLNHFMNRIEIYNAEEFEYKTYKIRLEEKCDQ